MNMRTAPEFLQAVQGDKTMESVLQKVVNDAVLEVRPDIIMDVPYPGILVTDFVDAHDGPSAKMTIDPQFGPDAVRVIGRVLNNAPTLPDDIRLRVEGDYDEVTTSIIEGDRLVMET